MAETYTTNKSLAMVTVGTDPGTWGPFVNLNPQLLDNMLGGTATIVVNNAPVILSSAQYQCAFLRFTGALNADVQVTFPAVGSFYTIINDTSNSSSFCLTATVPAGRTIGIPPGSMTNIMTDGANPRYTALPPVGTYWDYAGSSVPRWVNSCTIPPFLNCDGTTFSSATYPNLHAAFNNSNVLPDSRGNARFSMNQGTGRTTTGLDGDTLHAIGGDQRPQDHNHTGGGTTTGVSAQHTHQQAAATLYGDATPSVQNAFGGNMNSNIHNTGVESNDHTHAYSFTTANSGGGAGQNIPPGYTGGITMVRAA